MKKYILFILFIVPGLRAQACDVCGCSLGGNYFGILPQYSKNFIGVRWSQAKFHAHMNHQSNHLLPESSEDTFNKMEIWGRFYVTPKVQVFAFIPYHYNSMKGTVQNVSSQGLGDITLAGNYLLINTGENYIGTFKHTLVAGAGIKLPTGEFKKTDNDVLLNPNFQLGTGSVDFLLTTVYTLRFQQLGITTESGYKMNTKNSNQYLFGNQFHLASQLFYWQNIGAFALLPNGGLYYENGKRHKDGEIIQPNTGGYNYSVTAGLDVYYNNMTLGFNFKHPLKQQYHTDNIAAINAKDRLSLAFTYNF